MRRIAIATGLLAVLLLGALGGWKLRSATEDNPRPIIVRRNVNVVTQGVAKSDVAPSVVGLDEDAARQAFADAGMAPDRIKTESKPNVEAPGTVVMQAPAAAAPLGTAGATLTVATPARVPDVIGKDEDSARQAFDDLGATVRVVSRFEAGAQEGSVLSTRPAVGARLGTGATLVIAAAESSASLTDLQRFRTSCEQDATRTIDGSELAGLLACATSQGTSPAVDVMLDGKASVFTGSLTLPDDAPTKASVSYRVEVDGHQVAAGTVTAGTPVKLRADVNQGRHLILELDGGRTAAEAVLMDAEVSGARTDIDQLTGAAP